MPGSRALAMSQLRADFRMPSYHTNGGLLKLPSNQTVGSHPRENRRRFLNNAGWKKMTLLDYKAQESRAARTLEARLKREEEESKKFRPRRQSTNKVSEKQMILQFHQESNLALKHRTARDQGNFRAVSGCLDEFEFRDPYVPLSEGQRPWQEILPNTSTKAANKEARLKMYRDQAGMFDGGKMIGEHSFRDLERATVAATRGKHPKTFSAIFRVPATTHAMGTGERFGT